MNDNNINIPWVEKYRPKNFENIVLDEITKTILSNILKTNNFPNLLLYGPPGTGKTTTIINLVNEYRRLNNEKGKSQVIHLNASDERGIDIIRNQINQFVNSMNMFCTGTKFIILDEVDYMTYNAQHALKQLLQSYNNVRYCLICNYITKIDESLRNEFVKIRFNQLPKKNIIEFLNNICLNEKINMNDKLLMDIQTIFGSDIRSMINFIQSNIKNSNEDYNKVNIITKEDWEKLHNIIKNYKENKNYSYDIKNYIIYLKSKGYSVKNILKDYSNFLIINEKDYIDSNLLDKIEFITHINVENDINIMNYFINNIIKK